MGDIKQPVVRHNDQRVDLREEFLDPLFGVATPPLPLE